ncbi:S-layer homology domain-containing protein [Cohnella sp. 56]|uniref:S-layer homology domain-containing protein n=1 Tax=Cohnella sp. 56 TaxID=3113722 RepID=UPI0030E75175
MKRKSAGMLALWLVICQLLTAATAWANDTSAAAPITLVSPGAVWSYSDTGADHSASVTQTVYDVSGWKTGPAPLGFKELSGVSTGNVAPASNADFGNAATIVSYGSDRTKKYPTTYFSRTITIDSVAALESLSAQFAYDDGIVFYINGVEQYRGSMPAGSIAYTTLATTNLDKPQVQTQALSVGALKDGVNQLMVEVHQSTASSSDLYFAMKLTAMPKSAGGDNGSGGGTSGESVLLAKNTGWKVMDTGADLGTAWRDAQADDSAWTVKQAPLGYPVGKSAEPFGAVGGGLIGYGPDSAHKYPTTYFRTTFQAGANLSDYRKIVGTFGVDDGVVLYLNGIETYRFNMPAGEPTYETFSAETLNDPETVTADLTAAFQGVLKSGTNVLAVEVHQRSASSSDLYWDMQLVANPENTDGGTGGGTADPKPFNVALNFNGDPRTDLGFGYYTDPSVTGTKLEVVEAALDPDSTFPAGVTAVFEGASTTVNVFKSSSDKSGGKATSYSSHKVKATGLKPGTTYRYRLGDGAADRWSEMRTFRTEDADLQSFHFIYATDPQGTTAPEYVTWKHTLDEAMKTVPDPRFLIVTGDLVDNGDLENQWSWLLDTPKDILRSLPIAPILGNHESKGYNNFAYHFNTPNLSATNALPEGSVYAYDYGPATFFVLNTEYSGAKSADLPIYEAQVNWLRSEAAKSDKKWKIVMFHKSPYSVANHVNDSDVVFYRNNLTKVFDELGIDAVLSGHDHTYTRSYPMYDNVPQTDTYVDSDGNAVNPKGTLYMVTNAAGDKRYTPGKGPFPYAAKFGQPNKEMFTDVSVTADTLSLKTYTTLENGTTDLYDTYSIKKTEPKPGKVADAKLGSIADGKLTLTWNAPSSGPDVQAYRIYEKQGLLGPNWNATVGHTAGTTAYALDVTGVDAARTYQFVIRAVSGKTASDGVVAEAETIASPTPSATPSPTPSATPSPTPSATPSPTPSATPSPTPSATPSPTPSATPSPTPSATPSPTPSATPSPTPSATPSPTPVLKDIGTHWAAGPIRQALELGFVQGYGDGTFKPEQQVNRAEFITMLVRALQPDASSAGASPSSFADASGIPAWARDSVAHAVAAGFISGYADGTFRPNRELTRLEMVVLIVRASGIPVPAAPKLGIADAKDVPAWAAPYVAAALDAKLIAGVGGNRFAPNEIADRAQAVTIILGALNRR